MKSFVTILLIIFINTSNILAQEYQGKIVPEGPTPVRLKKGDLFKAKISLWPKASVLYNDILKLEETKFLDSFYVAEVEKINHSPNNDEVLAVSVLLVFLDNKNIAPVWEFGDLKIPIKIQGIEMDSIPVDTPKGFMILSQDTNGTTHWIVYLILILLLILLGVTFYFFNKTRQNKKKIELEKQRINEAMNLLREAFDRNTFEEIYEKRKYLLKEFGSVKEELTTLMSGIDQFQYKKELDLNELQEAKEKRDLVLKKLENNGI